MILYDTEEKKKEQTQCVLFVTYGFGTARGVASRRGSTRPSGLASRCNARRRVHLQLAARPVGVRQRQQQQQRQRFQRHLKQAHSIQ